MYQGRVRARERKKYKHDETRSLLRITMKVRDWFKTFIEEYRKFIKEEYEEHKHVFPFYQPVEIHVYLIEDDKSIFPDVLLYVIFIDEENEEFLSDDIFIFEKKIEWPDNFNDLDGYEKQIAFWEVEHETFKESSIPFSLMHLSFSKSIFKSNPKDQARILVHENFLRGFERSLVEKHMQKCILRNKGLGNENIEQILYQLENIQNIRNDEEKACLISKIFWLLGFEILNLEEMKHIEEFNQLNSIPHVDVLAFLPFDKILVAIEEGPIEKNRWYKLSSVGTTLKNISIEESKWTIINIMIGRVSSGVSYLEGNVRKINYEDFFNIVKDLLIEKRNVG